MFTSSFSSRKSTTLMGEYASLLGEAALRHRTRTAEHSARIEAELANRVKSEFISNMSHELRTPLNTVIGFSKLISEHDKRRLPEAEIIEYANLIHDAAGHLLAVINDILDISKLQSGRFTLDAREINVDEVIRSAISNNMQMAKEAGITVETLLAPGLPHVRGDSAKLRQILSNIISNAVKFTRSGGKVSIETITTAEGGAGILVRDTGIGMTAEEISVALTPFGQVDGARSRWREGTGLGLPIARALIDLHGGKLSITSEKGVGTVVSIMLPSPDTVSVAKGRDQLLGLSI